MASAGARSGSEPRPDRRLAWTHGRSPQIPDGYAGRWAMSFWCFRRQRCLPRDHDGRVLLVRISDTGQWAVIGGAIEPDEPPEHAALREAEEEAGVTLRLGPILAVLGGPEFRLTYPNGDQTSYVSTVFDATVVGGTPTPDGDETLAVEWWSRDAVPYALEDQRVHSGPPRWRSGLPGLRRARGGSRGRHRETSGSMFERNGGRSILVQHRHVADGWAQPTVTCRRAGDCPSTVRHGMDVGSSTSRAGLSRSSMARTHSSRVRRARAAPRQ